MFSFFMCISLLCSSSFPLDSRGSTCSFGFARQMCQVVQFDVAVSAEFIAATQRPLRTHFRNHNFHLAFSSHFHLYSIDFQISMQNFSRNLVSENSYSMTSVLEMRKLVEAKVQTMIRHHPKKEKNGEAEPKKEEEEKFESTYKQKENLAINPSSSGKRPLYSKYVFLPLSIVNVICVVFRVDINCDKWLMTLDEQSRLKLENPPSLADGLTNELEAVSFYRNFSGYQTFLQEIRYLGCELIQQGAILLRLPQTAAATGQILFQRFFYQRSFVRYHFEVSKTEFR